MFFLKELSEFLNLIEPFLVFIVFVFQIVLFFLIKKKEIETDQIWADIKLHGLKWLKQQMKNQNEKSNSQNISKSLSKNINKETKRIQDT